MERDSVDTILGEWLETSPELDVSGRHILWRLKLVDRHIDQRMLAMVSEFGLSDSAFKLLLRLLRAGPPYSASPSDMARETLYSSGAMTNLIARVESQGLVTRTPAPDDRRGVRVSLTPEGLDVITRAHAAYMEQERSYLESLSPEERNQLIVLLRKMLLSFEND